MSIDVPPSSVLRPSYLACQVTFLPHFKQTIFHHQPVHFQFEGGIGVIIFARHAHDIQYCSEVNETSMLSYHFRHKHTRGTPLLARSIRL
jgi:hypothetical protein